MRQPTKRWRSCVLTLKYTFICVYWWTRQRIHNTLIVVDRYLRLMGDKTIPDSAEPRLESFYPPFVAGIDLPHQGVVDSYNLQHNCVGDSIVYHSESDLEFCWTTGAASKVSDLLSERHTQVSLCEGSGVKYSSRPSKISQWFANAQLCK